MRADVLTLLNALPDSRFDQKQDEENHVSAGDDNGSGDYSGNGAVTPDYLYNYDDNDDSVIELVFHGSEGKDIDLLTEHGVLTESATNEITENTSNGNITVTLGGHTNERAYGLFEKDNDDDNTNTMPKFEKYVQGSRNQPRLIRGQNTNTNNNWLGYSLLGSIGAIFVTVSATVCVRRIKSNKSENSGTPIQKLKRYQVAQNGVTSVGGHGATGIKRGRTVSHVNFGTGYNPAFRPQFFNPNQQVHGGFSSSLSSSGSSGFGVPNQVPPPVHQGYGAQSQLGHHANATASSVVASSHAGSVIGHDRVGVAHANSMSSGYGSNSDRAQQRALPPPPYAKVYTGHN